MERLHIGMISYGLPVIGQKRGGIERVAHDLAEGLARRGHTVTVWSYDPHPAEASYEVRPLPGRSLATSWLGRRITMGYLGNVLLLVPDYTGCDVLLAHGDSVLLPLLGRPLVRTMHGSALGEALTATSPWRFVHQLGVYLQELWCGLTQTGCVGVSANSRRYNPFVRQVIPLGIDTSRFRPDGSAKTQHPSVLFVGVLGGRKRGALLLKWFERHVLPRHPTATLEMVCPPGPQQPNVRYHLGLAPEELAALYRSAWVYASPSSYEGFGLPYLEAMASGTAVLASPNPGSREVLAGGQFGWLVPDEEFGPALGNLLANPAELGRLTALGLDRAREYSLDVMVERYERLLTALCAQRKCRSGAGFNVRTH